MGKSIEFGGSHIIDKLLRETTTSDKKKIHVQYHENPCFNRGAEKNMVMFVTLKSENAWL